MAAAQAVCCTSKDDILDIPWCKDFLESLHNITEKYGVSLLQGACRLDRRNSEMNKRNMEICLTSLEEVFQDMTYDMDSLLPKYVDEKNKLLERVKELEKKLRIEPSYIAQIEELPVKEATEMLQSQIKKLENDLSQKQEEWNRLTEKLTILSTRMGHSYQSLPENYSPTTSENFKCTVEILEREFADKEAEELVELNIKLDNLWKCLDISIEERLYFMDSLQATSQDSILLLTAEIERLEDAKKNRIQDLVESKKKILSDLWDDCECLASIRNEFPLIYTLDYTEENLERFQAETQKWRDYYDDHKEILTTLKAHRKLKNQLNELELNIDKTELYKNRGCKLLTEIRKMDSLRNQIKKTEEKLLTLSKNYQKLKKINFLTFGETIEVYIKKQSENKQISQDRTPKAREMPKKFKTPLTDPRRKKTPVPKVTTKLPAFKLNQSSSSPTKKLLWKPSRASINFNRNDEEDSWTDYSEFETEVKDKPRSTGYFQ